MRSGIKRFFQERQRSQKHISVLSDEEDKKGEKKTKRNILNFKQTKQEINADLLNVGHAIQIFLLLSSKLASAIIYSGRQNQFEC